MTNIIIDVEFPQETLLNSNFDKNIDNWTIQKQTGFAVPGQTYTAPEISRETSDTYSGEGALKIEVKSPFGVYIVSPTLNIEAGGRIHVEAMTKGTSSGSIYLGAAFSNIEGRDMFTLDEGKSESVPVTWSEISLSDITYDSDFAYNSEIDDYDSIETKTTYTSCYIGLNDISEGDIILIENLTYLIDKLARFSSPIPQVSAEKSPSNSPSTPKKKIMHSSCYYISVTPI